MSQFGIRPDFSADPNTFGSGLFGPCNVSTLLSGWNPGSKPKQQHQHLFVVKQPNKPCISTHNNYNDAPFRIWGWLDWDAY